MSSLPLRGALASHVVLAALIVGCSSWSTQVNAAEKAVQDRKPAPDFMLTDAKGASTKLSDYKGSVVLLNFWATWCGPCKIEIPWFVEFQNKYQDRGLAVLGVSMDEDGWQAVRPFIATHNMNYRVAIGTVVVNAPPARTVRPCTVDEDDMFTSDCCALKFGVLDRTAAHNIVANTANRLNITTSSSLLLSSDFNRMS